MPGVADDIIKYLNFIASLEASPDQTISDIIDERAQFISVGQSDIGNINSAVDNVFDNLNGLAKDLESAQIAKQAAEAAIDFFTSGISKILGLDDLLSKLDGAKADVDKAESNLNDHISGVSTDISNQIGGPYVRFVSLFKQNNNHFTALSTGLSFPEIRSTLYNFVGYISDNGGADVKNFRRYSQAARRALDSASIRKIEDIFTEFQMFAAFYGSNDDEKHIKFALGRLKLEAGLDSDGFGLTTNLFFNYLIGSGVSVKSIADNFTGVAGVLQGVLSLSLFGQILILGGLFGGGISGTIKSYNENISNFDKARQQYKDCFKKLHDSASEYSKSIQ